MLISCRRIHPVLGAFDYCFISCRGPTEKAIASLTAIDTFNVTPHSSQYGSIGSITCTGLVVSIGDVSYWRRLVGKTENLSTCRRRFSIFHASQFSQYFAKQRGWAAQRCSGSRVRRHPRRWSLSAKSVFGVDFPLFRWRKVGPSAFVNIQSDSIIMQILAGGRECWILWMRTRLLSLWTIWEIPVGGKSFATFTPSSLSHLLGFRPSFGSPGLSPSRENWNKIERMSEDECHVVIKEKSFFMIAQSKYSRRCALQGGHPFRTGRWRLSRTLSSRVPPICRPTSDDDQTCTSNTRAAEKPIPIDQRKIL